MDKTNLTESQEILLSKFVDNECSWLERIRVRRLLERSPQARSYIHSLDKLSTSIKASVSIPKPELWFRVGARINSEEKTAALLGARRMEARESFLNFRVVGSLAGACAVALIVIMPKGTFSVRDTTRGSGTFPQEVASSQVNSGSVVPVGSFDTLSRRAPAPVEVDWVRSDGRVQVMHDSADRAPIIWVKRKRQLQSGYQIPERNSQGIIMMNRGAPQGLSISSTK